MRDESISYEEVERVTEADGVRYDIVFVDDAAYHEEVKVFLERIDTGKIVFLSSRDRGDEIGTAFDTVIKKPFLPSQIQTVIDSVEPAEEEIALEKIIDEADEEHFIFPLATTDEQEIDMDDEAPLPLIEEEEAQKGVPVEEECTETPLVLDENEVERIKSLLEDDEEEVIPSLNLEDEAEVEARKVEVITQKLEEEGLEIVEEEEIIAALSDTPKKKKKKSKKAKKKKRSKEEIYTFEEALLAAIENMKPKKIKKLLKGAEVTIKIRFKEEE
jgi:hypothetical protein